MIRIDFTMYNAGPWILIINTNPNKGAISTIRMCYAYLDLSNMKNDKRRGFQEEVSKHGGEGSYEQY